MKQHLLTHAITCATLKLAVEIIVGTACVMAFGWLWSAAVTVLVTGSRLYAARVSEQSWRNVAKGDESCSLGG